MRTTLFSCLPSHIPRKLQPCDVGVLGSLKTAYREHVEGLEHGGVDTIGKQRFTLLYDQARQAALITPNIRSGWAKTGLYPFDLNRVLQDIPRPSAQACQISLAVDTALIDELLRTPVTSEHLVSLRRAIELNLHALDDHTQQCFQNFANEAETAVSARDLLFHDTGLFKQNNESDFRESTKSTVVGKGIVMSVEEIREARKKRKEKEASEEKRRGRKRKKLKTQTGKSRGWE